jgi:nitrogen-specific signal transduction histidine kinase
MPQIKKVEPKKESKTVGKKEIFYDLNGLVKENYLIGLDSAHSLLEENKRLMDEQIEQLRKIQHDYTERIKSLVDKLPKEYSGLGISEKLDRIIEFQNNFYAVFKKLSDNYSKELLDLNQKSAERAFSAFDKYVSSFNS